MINPQRLELPMSWTNFNGPNDVQAIEIRLYSYTKSAPNILTLLKLNMTCPVLANSTDPDQLASEEASTVCH